MRRFLIFLLFCIPQCHAMTYDVVVYGGTSAGVIAAVQAARSKKSVILIEPGKHLGGMTSGGLGYIDIANTKAIGGMCREYFYRVWRYYQDDKHWVWEPKRALADQRGGFTSKHEKAMWLLEPHVGENIFGEMVAEAKVPILFDERLDRTHGVEKIGRRITQITMVSGLKISGKIFIDATYEGDLMAAGQVSYTIGREDNARYGETLNGVFINRTTVPFPICPYRIKGSPESGLLPRVYPFPEDLEGKGDQGVQAYNFRLCLTDHPQNRMPIEKPLDYDEIDYELLFRIIEADDKKVKLFKLNPLPNRKFDANAKGAVSTDFVGMSWNWPEADEVTRRQMVKDHERWQRGLLWTLQHHPRVPDDLREFYSQYGLAKDEFSDNGHWPNQLYIREARRMISDFVMTEDHVRHKKKIQDVIGMASYHSIDCHAIKYCVNAQGLLTTEGCLSVKSASPIPVSYQAIVPKREECENLLVPVCLSASHVAYCGLRMEPVFMILGQSAAIAACLSLDLSLPLQDLPYLSLRQKLLDEKQIIEWSH